MTPGAAASTHGPLTQVMLMVMLACLPGASASMFFFGWGVLLNLAWLMLLAVAMEAAVLKLRARPVLPGLRDCSALVTATLLALALPPTAPWWLGLIGVFVAIVVAKQLYGGIGRNLLNPAMAGYAVLLLAFPLQMTRWLLPEGATTALPSFTDTLLMFIGREPDAGIDAFTGATTLDSFRQNHGGQLVSEFMANSPLAGTWSGRGWEWINVGFLMGGLYLVYRRIITWHIPLSLLTSLFLWALLFHDGGSSASSGAPLFHVFGGATMLGAFFVATDPVTAPATARGKIVYGVLIGALIFAYRAWSSYPDGVAFAVLLANLTVPVLDTYARQGANTRFAPGKNWTLTIAALAAAALLTILAAALADFRRPDAERAMLAEVMPANLHDNDLTAARFTIDPAAGRFRDVELLGLDAPRSAYRATLNAEVRGVVLPVTAPRGYNGPIELLIGIDSDGTVTGVRAVHHDETRNLGDAIEPGVSNWILGFDNRSLANTDDVLWAVKKDGGDFDQFVGATITPRVTVNAVHDALLFFDRNRTMLLQR